MSRTNTIIDGSLCPRCQRGTLKEESRASARDEPRKSEVLFRCTFCNGVIRTVQDDRLGR